MLSQSDDSDNVVITGPSRTLTKAILEPRSIHLRDRVTAATIYPIFSPIQLPLSLVIHLSNEYNDEIETGQTLPLEEGLPISKFKDYWFGSFAAVMLKGEESLIRDGRDWANEALGTFYCKPNYPGRCSHICSASFLVARTARNQGVGKLLAEAYLDYAPKLGYTYSMFNLVFETSIAALKIWDALGFKRIGRVKGAARLEGYENKVDAIIYGRDLGDNDEYVSDERFDKIRYYLEKGKYPPAANRSEKSRLRSAATHYRLEKDKLMLKDKEVVSDPQRQYEIARNIHSTNHGGINKTTANIAEKYHWVQIKKTVSQVIRNCTECKEHHKAPLSTTDRASSARSPRDDASSSCMTVDTPVLETTLTLNTMQSSLSPVSQHGHHVSQTSPTQHESVNNLPLNLASQNIWTSDVSSDSLVDSVMIDDVRHLLQTEQYYRHHHNDLVPVTSMHESILNISPTSNVAVQHQYQRMQSYNDPNIIPNLVNSHRQMSYPVPNQIRQQRQQTTFVEEMMFDDDDDLRQLQQQQQQRRQQQLYNHNSQSRGSASSLSNNGKPEHYHALHKLAEALKGSQEYDHDLYTL